MPPQKGRGTKRKSTYDYKQNKRTKMSHTMSKPNQAQVQVFQETINSGLNPYRYIGQKTKIYPEIKYHEESNTAAMSDTGTVVSLPQIATGVNNGQRIGRQIQVKNVVLRCNIQQDATTPNTYDYVRLLIVVDKEAELTAAPNQILQQLSTISHYNWEERGRFEYLWDKTYTLSRVEKDNLTILQSVPINRVTTYSSSTSTSYKKNNVYFVYLCAAGSNKPVINYNVRLKYRDV